MNTNRGISRTAMIGLLLLAAFIGWWANPNRGYAATTSPAAVSEQVNPNWWMTRTCQKEYQTNCYADERFAAHPYVIRTIPGPVTCTFYINQAYAAQHDNCVKGRGEYFIAGPDTGLLLPWWTGRTCRYEGAANCYWPGKTGEHKGHPFRTRAIPSTGGFCILYTEQRYSQVHDQCYLGKIKTGVMPRGELR